MVEIQESQTWQERMDKDIFIKSVGITIVEAEEGYCQTQLIIGPQHLNGLGVAQGGAIFTLADFAFAAATNAGNSSALGIQNDIRFIKAAYEGDILTATCRVCHQGGRIGFYAVEIKNQKGELIALFNATSCRVSNKQK